MGQNLHVTLHNITTIWIRTDPHLGVFEMKFYPFFLGSNFHFCQGLGFWNRFSCGQTIGSPHYKDDSEFTQSHPTTKTFEPKTPEMLIEFEPSNATVRTDFAKSMWTLQNWKRTWKSDALAWVQLAVTEHALVPVLNLFHNFFHTDTILILEAANMRKLRRVCHTKNKTMAAVWGTLMPNLFKITVGDSLQHE